MNKIKITKEMLNGTGPKILSTGTTNDEELNFYGWGDKDKELKFVVCKGFINDWCVYVENMDREQSFKSVEEVGNKLSPYTAKKIIDCDDEVWARYRL